MSHENPFTPSFGEIPAHLAGRKDIVEEITRAFESALRRPELTTILSGRKRHRENDAPFAPGQPGRRAWLDCSERDRPARPACRY